MRPREVEEPVQQTLFIENIPLKAEDLTEANMKDLDTFLSQKLILNPDKTISGYRFGLLSIFASPHGISDAVLKEYLLRKGIKMDSKLPPEKPSNNIKFH